MSYLKYLIFLVLSLCFRQALGKIQCDAYAEQIAPCTCDNNGLLSCVGPEIDNEVWNRAFQLIPTIYGDSELTLVVAHTNISTFEELFSNSKSESQFHKYSSVFIYANHNLSFFNVNVYSSSQKTLLRLEIFDNSPDMTSNLEFKTGFFNKFTKLKKLRLSGIGLSSVYSVFNATSFDFDQKLEILDLSHNKLTEIDLVLSGVYAVKNVDLSNKKIDAIYATLPLNREFELKSINFTNNALGGNSFKWGDFSALINKPSPKIDLRENNITFFDEAVFNKDIWFSPEKFLFSLENFVCDLRTVWIVESQRFAWLLDLFCDCVGENLRQTTVAEMYDYCY